MNLTTTSKEERKYIRTSKIRRFRGKQTVMRSLCRATSCYDRTTWKGRHPTANISMTCKIHPLWWWLTLPHHLSRWGCSSREPAHQPSPPTCQQLTTRLRHQPTLPQPRRCWWESTSWPNKCELVNGEDKPWIPWWSHVHGTVQISFCIPCCPLLG